MHVLGIVGSMRTHKYTHMLVARVISEIRRIEPMVVDEMIYIADKDVHPCKVMCSRYCSSHPYQCTISDDVGVILERMIQADVLVIGAPLYFRGPPAKFQAWVERLISLFFFQETQDDGTAVSPLAGKVCGLVGVAEYSNPHQVLEYLHDFCTVLQMRPVRLARFPYLGVAGQGELEEADPGSVFKPFERCKDLGAALVAAGGVGSR